MNVRNWAINYFGIPDSVPRNVKDKQIDQLIESRLLEMVMDSPYKAGRWEGDPKYANDARYVAATKYADNPFGPWSFRLNFCDGSKGKQHLHTTASSFTHFLQSANRGDELYTQLGSSHGCIHIAWADLKELVDKQWAKKGRMIITHPYGKAAPTLPVLPYR
jgi:hypothetical protein